MMTELEYREWAYEDLTVINISVAAFIRFFRKLLNKGAFMILVVGDPGKGKSLLVASMCEKIDPHFCQKDVIGKLSDLKDRIREKLEGGEKWGLLNLDDFGSELDPSEFSMPDARKASHMAQKWRTFHLGYFLTVPDKAFINKSFRERIPNYLIEVLGFNASSGYTMIKLHRLQNNQRSGKCYTHNLYLSEKGEVKTRKKDGFVKLPKICIHKPSEGFLEWYLPFRDMLALRELENEEKTAGAGELDDVVRKKVANKNLVVAQFDNDVEKIAAVEKYMKVLNGKVYLDKDAVSNDFGYSTRYISRIQARMREKGYMSRYAHTHNLSPSI
jgi:hypothetical protein